MFNQRSDGDRQRHGRAIRRQDDGLNIYVCVFASMCAFQCDIQATAWVGRGHHHAPAMSTMMAQGVVWDYFVYNTLTSRIRFFSQVKLIIEYALRS